MRLKPDKQSLLRGIDILGEGKLLLAGEQLAMPDLAEVSVERVLRGRKLALARGRLCRQGSAFLAQDCTGGRRLQARSVSHLGALALHVQIQSSQRIHFA